MDVGWMQEVGRGLSSVRVAIHAVVRSRTRRSGVRHISATGIVHARPLRVVKHVEGFGAKLDRFRLSNPKALEHAHVEVEAAGPSERITPRIAKGKARGLRVGSGIVEQGTVHYARHRKECGLGAVRISDEIGIRT